VQGEIRRVAGVADSATNGMELPPQRAKTGPAGDPGLPPQPAKTGPAGDPGLAARRRWVEENRLKPKSGLSGPPVRIFSGKMIDLVDSTLISG
jgi:hypothetical protein